MLKNFDPINTENFVKNWPDSAPELNPKTILGISTTHETSACIVRDGKILSAISEERVSRVKLDSSFPPVRAIKEVIDVSKINPKSIDAVAISGLNWRALIPRTLESQSAIFLNFMDLMITFHILIKFLSTLLFDKIVRLWRCFKIFKIKVRNQS